MSWSFDPNDIFPTFRMKDFNSYHVFTVEISLVAVFIMIIYSNVLHLNLEKNHLNHDCKGYKISYLIIF